MRGLIGSLAVVAFAVGAPAPAPAAQRASADSAHWARVAGAGRLWANLQLFHPWLASSTRLDWDSVLVAVLPEVEQASGRADYHDAVAHLLEALHDPVTRVHDSFLLNGPDSSIAELSLVGANGRSRTVRLPRSLAFRDSLFHLRKGAILRVLPGNIGYTDLDRLGPAMVDSMFRLFRDTRGIVFDMRGYPQATAWAIAPHLTRARQVVAARFRTPVAVQPAGSIGDMLGGTAVEVFEQTLPPPVAPWYSRPTVMLIDENTQSQAEHTGLFFEAANGTRFVGSQTAGANGDISNFQVPGGILIWFSGHDVRHADGRQLQRVGLKPDLVVRPTIAGIRAGRDEVLERGMQYLLKLSSAAK
jgi:C-terminal processing protease CtpA/Prc